MRTFPFDLVFTSRQLTCCLSMLVPIYTYFYVCDVVFGADMSQEFPSTQAGLPTQSLLTPRKYN